MGRIQIDRNVKSQIGCTLALINFSFCLSSGPVVQHYCHGITIGSLPLNRQEILYTKYQISENEVIEAVGKQQQPKAKAGSIVF